MKIQYCANGDLDTVTMKRKEVKELLTEGFIRNVKVKYI